MERTPKSDPCAPTVTGTSPVPTHPAGTVTLVTLGFNSVPSPPSCAAAGDAHAPTTAQAVENPPPQREIPRVTKHHKSARAMKPSLTSPRGSSVTARQPDGMDVYAGACCVTHFTS